MVNRSIIDRVKSLEREAHKIFSTIESSTSRIVSLDSSYQRLSRLSVKQDDLVRQSLRCIQGQLFRAAHVMCWASLMDYLEEYAAEDGFERMNKARPKWQIESISDLRDRFGDTAIIDAMKAAGIITKTEQKGLQSLLTRRNECAHPGDYYPDFNMTLGYVAEVLHRFEQFEQKRAKEEDR